MNYYEHHIGDYDKSTAHLTACEDGIYCRLMRRYYDTEAPLPLEVKAVQRLVRARTPEELEAVEVVLGEFFVRAEDGWRHGRCDEEIARYQLKREKAAKSATARWSKSERGAPAMRTHCDRNANASKNDANAPPEHCDRNANASAEHDGRNALQSPDTRHHSAVSSSQHAARAPADAGAAMTEAGRACRLMREAGCATTNPSHPDLLAALGEGCTPEELAATVAEAIAGGIRKPFPWAISTARGRRADGPRPMTTGASHANHDHGAAAGGGPRLSLADRAAQRAQDILARRAERDRAAG